MKTSEETGPKRPGRVLISMPDDVRAALQKEAFTHSRTLTAEINMRLRASLRYPADQLAPNGHRVMESPKGVGNGLDEIETSLRTSFRKLPLEKKLALLALLK